MLAKATLSDLNLLLPLPGTVFFGYSARCLYPTQSPHTPMTPMIRSRLVVSLITFVFPAILLSSCAATLPPNAEPPMSGGEANAVIASAVATVEAGIEERIAAIESDPDAVNTEAIIAQVLNRLSDPPSESEQPLQINYSEPLAVEGADNALQKTLIDLYRKTNPAVVFIIVPPIGSGSGFVFSDDGHIVTNNHVVDQGRTFEIAFADGERKAGQLIGRDVDSDLAVLKVDILPENVAALPLAEASAIAVGQFVVAIGNPFGEQGSMSLGIVSGLDRSLRSQRNGTRSSYSLPEVIQTDAPINPGNSGGPLLNLDGEVVGVNSAIATSTGANSGVGFSIPVAAVRRLIPVLIEKGVYDYPYMGVSFAEEISLLDQTTFDLPQTQGAYVLGVASDGPADQAGLRGANSSTGRGGDLIIEIDGVPINDFSDLNGYLVFSTTVGQTINIIVLRDDKRVELPLTLGAREFPSDN